jgi:hypothetical protein
VDDELTVGAQAAELTVGARSRIRKSPALLMAPERMR